jgi:hypothetical protein
MMPASSTPRVSKVVATGRAMNGAERLIMARPRRAKLPPHPEERSAAERLEGWQQARCRSPPFETLAALAPQGEVIV